MTVMRHTALNCLLILLWVGPSSLVAKPWTTCTVIESTGTLLYRYTDDPAPIRLAHNSVIPCSGAAGDLLSDPIGFSAQGIWTTVQNTHGFVFFSHVRPNISLVPRTSAETPGFRAIELGETRAGNCGTEYCITELYDSRGRLIRAFPGLSIVKLSQTKLELLIYPVWNSEISFSCIVSLPDAKPKCAEKKVRNGA